MKTYFREFDEDSSHTISQEKLQSVLKHLDPTFTQEELDMLFDQADKNKNGVIEYDEFLDFVCFLGDDDVGVPPVGGLPPVGAGEVSVSPQNALLDIGQWKKAVQGAGAWSFMCDKQANGIRCIVRNFPDLPAQSPEGLTLAEEFILLWQEDKTGELAEYSYFGADEAYHNAVFGACLLGLRARNLLEFEQTKCAYMGTYYKLKLGDAAPEDSEVLKKVFEELQTKPENSLKMWFEEKSGKWGQDDTTTATLEALANRGILEKKASADALNKAKYASVNDTCEKAIKARLQSVIAGEVEADPRSLALIALCRTVDMRDMNTNVMMDHIYSGDKEKATAMTEKVDALVKDVIPFQGIGAEEINKMIDSLPRDFQVELCGDAFWTEAEGLFAQVDTAGTGKVSVKDMAVKLEKVISSDLLAKLKAGEGENTETLEKLVLMFDADSDGDIVSDEFVGFMMWARSMEKFGV